jgi:hypothetical protein
MVRELGRGEVFKASPLWGREIGQYHVQTVNFRASKKDLSIADIQTSAIPGSPLVAFSNPVSPWDA